MPDEVDLNEAVWEQVRATAEASCLPIFPSAPLAGDMPVVGWDDDVTTFVALGKRLGARLLYLASERLEQSDVDRWERSFMAAPPDEARGLLDHLERRIGDLIVIQVAWLADGVLHRWTDGARWYSESADALEELAAEVSEEWEDQRDLQFRSDARRLAFDPEFPVCTNDDKRKRLAEKLGLSAYLFFRGNEFLTEARMTFDEEVKPQLERRTAEQARSLLADGRSKKETARLCGIGVDRMERILLSYPPADSDE